MKPGVDLACTGVLPQPAAMANTVSASAGSVAAPLTTSTSAMAGTGLKKCIPTSRSGRRRALAIAVTDKDEVLVAKIASLASTASSSPNRRCLTPRSSTTASMTSSAGAKVGEGAASGQPVEQGGALAGRQLAALDALLQCRGDTGDRLVRGTRARIVEQHRVAGGSRDLGDAGTHGTAADDGDGASQVAHAPVLPEPLGAMPSAAV